MTTLENRAGTALLVIDVQNAALDRAVQRHSVVANVGSLVERARRDRIPVVWVQHSDEHLARESDGWQIVPELGRDDAEPLARSTTATPSRTQRLRACWAASALGGWSSSARRPTGASARRCTAQSPGATT